MLEFSALSPMLTNATHFTIGVQFVIRNMITNGLDNDATTSDIEDTDEHEYMSSSICDNDEKSVARDAYKS